MNPGLVVKLRPAGPWRIGPDSGARNRVDVIYHSDSVYAAVTGALARLGSLEEWLGATARHRPPAVCFSSCFPFLDEIGFVVPPRTIWPPTSPALLSARVRWKSARFVPLGIVQALLAGQTLDGNHWAVDGPSECLVPAGRPGPFRTGVRFSAAVDRLTGATERHSTACIEFRAGSGLWAIVSFRDEAARARWSDPVRAAFRLLADSGFGGERSRGWGRSEAPEFIEGTLPDMILPKPEAPAPLPTEPEPAGPLAASVEARPELAPLAMTRETAEPAEAAPAENALPAEAVGEQPNPEATAGQPAAPETAPVESAPAPAAESAEAASPAESKVAATAEPSAEPGAAPAAQEPPAAPAEAAPPAESNVAATAEPPAEPELGAEPATPEPPTEAAAAPTAGPREAAPAVQTQQSGAEPLAAPEAAPVQFVVPVEPVMAQPQVEGAEPESAPPVEPVSAQPDAEASAEPPAAPVEAESPAEAASAQAEAGAEPRPQPPSPPPALEPPSPNPEPKATESLAPGPRPPAPAFWLLSLFTPAASDAVDWRRGNYTLLARGGRIDSPAGSGELKKQLNMVAEGSVLLAASAPCGHAPDVAPEGFAHPVFRAGFALSIPLPPHHEVS